MTETTAETVDARARRRLRHLRLEQGLTLREVSERASIDVSTLSRLEAGKRRLALDHIPALAAALSVSTDELLGTTPQRDPRVRGEPQVSHGMTMWPLTRRGAAGGLQAYKIHIGTGRSTPPDTLPTHQGHDWFYVTAGRLRLLLGQDDLVIEAGEAVEFTTWTPHWFGALDGPVEVIAIFGPDGAHMHLRA